MSLKPKEEEYTPLGPVLHTERSDIIGETLNLWEDTYLGFLAGISVSFIRLPGISLTSLTY